MTHAEIAAKVKELAAKALKDPAFKKRLLADPMGTLESEGVEVPRGLEVRILENTSKVMHYILPAAPAEAGELSDEDLESVAGGKGDDWGDTFCGRCGTDPCFLTGPTI